MTIYVRFSGQTHDGSETNFSGIIDAKKLTKLVLGSNLNSTFDDLAWGICELFPEIALVEYRANENAPLMELLADFVLEIVWHTANKEHGKALDISNYDYAYHVEVSP